MRAHSAFASPQAQRQSRPRHPEPAQRTLVNLSSSRSSIASLLSTQLARPSRGQGSALQKVFAHTSLALLASLPLPPHAAPPRRSPFPPPSPSKLLDQPQPLPNQSRPQTRLYATHHLDAQPAHLPPSSHQGKTPFHSKPREIRFQSRSRQCDSKCSSRASVSMQEGCTITKTRTKSGMSEGCNEEEASRAPGAGLSRPPDPHGRRPHPSSGLKVDHITSGRQSPLTFLDAIRGASTPSTYLAQLQRNASEVHLAGSDAARRKDMARQRDIFALPLLRPPASSPLYPLLLSGAAHPACPAHNQSQA